MLKLPMMKTIILITTLLALLPLQCNGDISESLNQQLPLNSRSRIPSPTQSLLPPTFENPIKDYTVGLIPPPIDDTRPKLQQNRVQPPNHVHSNSNNTPRRRASSGFINTARPSFVNSVQQQQRNGYSAVHQKTHHSSNQLQPQVYQPKTTNHQSFQQFTAHHQPQPHPHHHHHHSTPTNYYNSAGIPRQPVAQHQHHHKHPVSAPQYYNPVTQNRVHHQHSTHTHYVSIPVQRAPPAAPQPAYPSVQKSAFVPRPVSSSSGGSSIVQSYPSVAYTATPQHGSTLNFGNAKLDPELVQIISEVYGQNY